MNKKILVLLLVLTNNILLANVKTDILFCTFDMGETNALIPVMKRLDQSKVNYKILALGKSREIFNKNAHAIDLAKECPSLLGVNVEWQRKKLLDAHDLSDIGKAIEAKIVISGMALALQAQLLSQFKEQLAYTIAYYDNFESPVGKEYSQAFLQQYPNVDEYIISCGIALSGFKQLGLDRTSTLTVLGQPSLETWDDIYRNTNQENLRKTLGINKDTTIFLFAGGYDDTYEPFFEMFVSAMKRCSNMQALVTFHPKTDGSLERNIVTKIGAANVHVIEKGSYSTPQLSTISTSIVCHKSTVGIQALYKNKPVIYVAQRGEYSNVVIENGLALHVDTEDELVNSLYETAHNSIKNTTAMSILGVPQESSKKIATHLKNLLI